VTGVRLTSLRQHPRAAPGIRRAKALGGLAGFTVSLLAGLRQGAPFAATLEHALVGGVVAHFLTWAAALSVWRRLLAAEAAALVRRSRQHGDAVPREAE
jgi:hypothetical protein